MKLVANPNARLCNECPSGLTKMVLIPRTKTYVCPICSSLSWHYANEPEPEEEGEYRIE